MKEIWKLIELYYEYKLDLLKRDMRGNWATEREIELVDIEKVDEDELEKNPNKLSELKPFIKWLVENDKLDLWSNTFTEKEEHYFWEQPDFTFQSVKYTHLLMLLSVSESPIDFLISILR
jgi:hypothetical protein